MTRKFRSRVLVGVVVAVVGTVYLATTGTPAPLAPGVIPDRLGAPADAAPQIALGPLKAVVPTTAEPQLPTLPAAIAMPPATDLPVTTAPVVDAAPPTAPPRSPPRRASRPTGRQSVPLDVAVRQLIIGDWESALSGWTVSFERARQGYKGITYPSRRRIEIYVRPGQSVAELAHVLAHELGHAIDVTYFTDAERAAFNVLRGRHPGSPWWVRPGGNDFASGSGDWAECFAWMVTGGRGGFFSRLGPPPDAAEQLAMWEMLDQKLLSA
jgi:hypothetical protein